MTSPRQHRDESVGVGCLCVKSPRPFFDSPRAPALVPAPGQGELPTKHAFLRKKRAWVRPSDDESSSPRELFHKERARLFAAAAARATAAQRSPQLTFAASALEPRSASQSPSARASAAMQAMESMTSARVQSEDAKLPSQVKRAEQRMGSLSRTRARVQSEDVKRSGHRMSSPQRPRVLSEGLDEERSPHVDGMPRGASKPPGGGVQEDAELRDAAEYDLCMKLAKRTGIHFTTVKSKHEEFLRFDTDKNGRLAPEEFEECIRRHCSLPSGAKLPAHLVHETWGFADKDMDGQIDFEEFLQWSTRHEFTEEWLVADEQERQLRHFVRENGLCILDIDSVKTIFSKLDINCDGGLCWDEFCQGIRMLKNAKVTDIPMSTMKRYWQEVDTDGSGDVTFEEFALWYFQKWQ